MDMTRFLSLICTGKGDQGVYQIGNEHAMKNGSNTPLRRLKSIRMPIIMTPSMTPRIKLSNVIFLRSIESCIKFINRLLFAGLPLSPANNTLGTRVRIRLFHPTELVCHFLQYDERMKQAVRILHRWHAPWKLHLQWRTAPAWGRKITAEIHIQSGYYYTYTIVGKLVAYINQAAIKELASSMPTTSISEVKTECWQTSRWEWRLWNDCHAILHRLRNNGCLWRA